jgi:hypothetical protein
MDHFKTAEFKENACYFSLAKYMVQLFWAESEAALIPYTQYLQN